jgi:hypothetical protein
MSIYDPKDDDLMESEMVVIEDELAKLETAKRYLDEAVTYLSDTGFLDMGSNWQHLGDVLNRLEDYIEERQINLEELDDRRVVNELFAG